MAHVRVSRLPQRSAAPRRKTSWLFGPAGNSGAISTSTSVLFPIALQSAQDGLTIVRIRGEILLYMTSGDGTTTGFEVAVGIGIANENAVLTVGVTAVPNPLTDAEWDGWMQYWTGDVRAASTTITNSEGVSAARITIDSKAMRKFRSSDVLFGCIQTVETTSAIMSSHLRSRVLVKLP